MGLRVQIHFTGLCAFIPETEIALPDNEAAVVLVNARQSHHGPHRSLLFFDPACYSITPASRPNRPAPTFFDYEGVRRRACSLGGEALAILGRDSAGQTLPLGRYSLGFRTGLRPNPALPCPSQTPNDEPDFTWVSRNTGEFEPTLLTATNRGDLIGVRTRLTAGTLSADKFRSSSQGRIRWWFNGSQPSALAEEILWELEFPDAMGAVGVTIASAPFQGYPQQPPLLLQPSGGVIEAWIVNMPLEDLLALDPPRPFDPDHHYEEYYRLCRGTPPTTIPVPDLASFCGFPIAVSNPKCPPTYFAASSLPASLTGPKDQEKSKADPDEEYAPKVSKPQEETTRPFPVPKPHGPHP